MTNTSYMVVSILMWLLKATVALQQSGLELGGRGGNRTQRDVSCTDNMEYLHINICCLKCPAGTYVKSPCTKAGQSGKCEECDYEMYTEHDNGLHQCLRCTKCRFDQEIVRPCLSTQNTECQCRSGWFCAPDQACEVCKKCSRCEEDEVKVRNCTAVSDTQCKKGRSGSGFASASVAAVIVPVVISAVIFGIIVAFVCRRRCRRPTDPESNPPNRLKEVLDCRDSRSSEERQNRENRRVSRSHLIQCRPVMRAKSSASTEDECAELWDSPDSSASNSQCSLADLVPPLPTCSPHCSPVVPRQHSVRENEPFPNLVPVNGEESLRNCFEYFEEMDFDYHKRFFRQLGIKDNVIKSKDHLQHEDRIHELLNSWIEKVGKEASLNDLLKVLLTLNQRLTAENIMVNATSNGHYVFEKE
ncbi:hematopoietic death receptor isoform X2 [Myripristis murdjan]|uniref:hematopoietic death receptor isoform X2 n=1 Tax=Myripristis murdjan TaxID=586833 RepID=UPI001175DA60|nr:tumor necrosis factor receptor superfamily member 10B-like isoform X2 [Myripristis murdjan]